MVSIFLKEEINILKRGHIKMGGDSKPMGRWHLELRKKTDYQGGEEYQTGSSTEIPSDCFVKSFEYRS